MTKPDIAPCGRHGCGSVLLCCRTDCHLVSVQLDMGLTRIYPRLEMRHDLARYI